MNRPLYVRPQDIMQERKEEAWNLDLVNPDVKNIPLSMMRTIAITVMSASTTTTRG